jgi:hypothetical protein
MEDRSSPSPDFPGNYQSKNRTTVENFPTNCKCDRRRPANPENQNAAASNNSRARCFPTARALQKLRTKSPSALPRLQCPRLDPQQILPPITACGFAMHFQMQSPQMQSLIQMPRRLRPQMLHPPYAALVPAVTGTHCGLLINVFPRSGRHEKCQPRPCGCLFPFGLSPCRPSGQARPMLPYRQRAWLFWPTRPGSAWPLAPAWLRPGC